ncbi:MAG: YraN family protein [Lachnospiraceae bacterium]|jgi:putative endonuclease|nr:YraN family protein [Lachnospiraceae bacterium]MCI1726647.1 YraN family protein [Lachnospiraceae bacterium]
MNKRSVGGSYEAMAAGFLKENGYRILEMNFRCRQGEIDIVAEDGEYLVFAEVKYRKDMAEGGALSAVDGKKRRQVSRTALFYLARNRIPENRPMRFDVVGITGNRIELVKNAFDYTA